jgi:hypothetical protein
MIIHYTEHALLRMTKRAIEPEWVEEGKTGFLAEAPTVHHLRFALERAWENRHRWAEMGEAARAACLAKRDPDPVGTLLGLLCEAAKQRRSDG